MLLVIHNLPSSMNYADIKQLIQSKSGLSHVILDNLKSDGPTKRVTVGLADAEDAALFVRKINGLYLGGLQLYVEDVRADKESEQPYRSNNNFNSGNALYSPSDVNYEQEYSAPQHFQAPVQEVNPMAAPNFGMGLNAMLYPAQVNAMNTMAMASNFSAYGVQASALAEMSQWGGVQDHRQNDIGFRQDTNDMARNYEDAYGGRGREPQGRGPKRGLSPQGRSDGFDASNRRPDGYDERPNTFDSRNRSKWDMTPEMTQQQRRDSPPRQSRYDNDPSFNVREDGNMRKKPRNDRSPWQEPPSWQDRSDRLGNVGNDSNVVWELAPEGFESSRNNFSDRQPARKSNAQENWREEPRQPPKRFRNRWGNEEDQRYNVFAPGKSNPSHNVRSRGSAPDKQQFSNSGQGRKVFSKEPVVYDSSSTQYKASKNPKTLENQAIKSNTWRGQAASAIAKAISKKFKLGYKDPALLFELKRCVRTRIDKMMGDDIQTRDEQIVQIFRSKYTFAKDNIIYNEAKKALVSKAKEQAKTYGTYSEEMSDLISSMPATIGSEASKPAAKPNTNKPANQTGTGGKPVKTNAAGPSKQPEPKTPGITDPNKVLPKYPKGDKKNMTMMKQIEKKELSGEQVYELPPQKQKIVDEYADTLCDLFMGECLNPTDKEEEEICEEINNNAADEFRKVIRLQMAKRVLNVTTGLVVQLYFVYKPPRNDILQAFLLDYDVVSLTRAVRSKTMFVAQCDSYEGFDKLCALGSVEIDGVTLNIRPRMATGQKVKRNNKRPNPKKAPTGVDESLLKMPVNDSGASNTDAKDAKDTDTTTDTKVTSDNDTKMEKDKNIDSNVVEDKNEDKNVIDVNMKSEDDEMDKNESEQHDDDWNGQWSDQENENADDKNQDENEQANAENNEFDNVDEEDLEDW